MATRSATKYSPADVLYVKFKPDSVLTISRTRFDMLTEHFGQDATFVTHFALSRLYEDVQMGRLNSAKQLPPTIAEGTRSPTEAEWQLLADVSAKAMRGKKFKPTQTLAQAWGIT